MTYNPAKGCCHMQTVDPKGVKNSFSRKQNALGKLACIGQHTEISQEAHKACRILAIRIAKTKEREIFLKHLAASFRHICRKMFGESAANKLTKNHTILASSNNVLFIFNALLINLPQN